MEKHVPPEELKEVKRILYGKPVEVLPVPEEVKKRSEECKLEVKAFKFGAEKEQLRPARVVRVALIQNSSVKPTTAPYKEQVSNLHSFFVTFHSPISETLKKKV